MADKFILVGAPLLPGYVRVLTAFDIHSGLLVRRMDCIFDLYVTGKRQVAITFKNEQPDLDAAMESMRHELKRHGLPMSRGFAPTGVTAGSPVQYLAL